MKISIMEAEKMVSYEKVRSCKKCTKVKNFKKDYRKQRQAKNQIREAIID